MRLNEIYIKTLVYSLNKTMQNKITKHHIIPKSKHWTSHINNIARIKDMKHRAFHMVFDNQTPAEQLGTIVDITWKAFNKVFADDIMSVINDYDEEEIYNEKCIKMEELRDYILSNK